MPLSNPPSYQRSKFAHFSTLPGFALYDVSRWLHWTHGYIRQTVVQLTIPSTRNITRSTCKNRKISIRWKAVRNSIWLRTTKRSGFPCGIRQNAFNVHFAVEIHAFVLQTYFKLLFYCFVCGFRPFIGKIMSKASTKPYGRTFMTKSVRFWKHISS